MVELTEKIQQLAILHNSSVDYVEAFPRNKMEDPCIEVCDASRNPTTGDSVERCTREAPSRTWRDGHAVEGICHPARALKFHAQPSYQVAHNHLELRHQGL